MLTSQCKLANGFALKLVKNWKDRKTEYNSDVCAETIEDSFYSDFDDINIISVYFYYD